LPDDGILEIRDKENAGTIRQQIMDLLSRSEVSGIQISQELGIPEKEVYVHLPHVERSVVAQGRQLVIRPSRCLNCQYVFEGRKRFTRPGRCPRCRSTRLERPLYRLS
jgi:predicted Zn-ribbon and HTH transcriptional regulator